MKRLLVVLGILAAVAVVGGAGYLGWRGSAPTQPAVVAPPTVAVERGDVVQTIDAPGQLASTHETIVSSEVSAPLSKLLVHAGQSVHAGDVLAELDDTSFQAAIRTAQASLDSAQSAYNAAVDKNAHNKDQIVVAKAALDKATITLQSAQAAYDTVAWRPDIGMMPQSAALQQATIDYQSALANYNLTLTSINDSALKSAAQTLVQAQEALKQAQENLAHTKLVAPFDGTVLEVLAKQGTTVAPGTGVVHLYDPHGVEAQTTVTEEDFPLARVGQEAQVYSDAQPDLVITGTVSYIVPLRDSSSSSPVYPVYIKLDHLPPSLAPGMTMDAKISVAKRTSVLRLPRALVHARANNTADVQVWNPARGQTENHTITVGLRGDQYVEVMNGLSEGELVVSQ